MEGNNEHDHEYIGRRIGNYIVRHVIACGAFGCVYMAQHKRIVSRIVAIKILHSYHRHFEDELDNFFQEAELLEQLRYPRILALYDADVIDETVPYIITEYAHGGSLRDMLLDLHRRNQLMPQEDALYILSQIGQGLAYTHRRGIIHRDLKPGNILFNKSDNVLLADFGIALLMYTPRGERRASLVGTPLYMAPEQFRGFAGPASDQYALGCIAYELFTGHTPFASHPNITLKEQHLYKTPIAPSRRNPCIPPYIEDAILTALEKEPQRRHASISTFMAALQPQPVYRQRHIQPVRARASQY